MIVPTTLKIIVINSSNDEVEKHSSTDDMMSPENVRTIEELGVHRLNSVMCDSDKLTGLLRRGIGLLWNCIRDQSEWGECTKMHSRRIIECTRTTDSHTVFSSAATMESPAIFLVLIRSISLVQMEANNIINNQTINGLQSTNNQIIKQIDNRD